MTGFIATYTCGNPACVNPEHTARSTRTRMNRIAEVKRRTDAKLSQADVDQIRASDDRYEDLAARFGVSKSLIGRVRRGEVWRTFSASPFSGLFA